MGSHRFTDVVGVGRSSKERLEQEEEEQVRFPFLLRVEKLPQTTRLT